MFPWSAFIGKLIELLLSKVVGKQLEFALDDRKRAAKAFLLFYEATVQIEILGKAFLTNAEPFLRGEQPRLYRAVFADLARDADRESTEFLASLKQLHSIIDLYDSDLARLLLGAGHMKGRLITSSFTDAMQFGFSPTKASVFALRYTAPSNALLNCDLHDILDSTRHAEEYLTMNNGVASGHWPKDLLFEMVTANTEFGVIEADRVDQLKMLFDLLQASLPSLTQAKDGLRKFMQDRFTFDDLLYATKRRSLDAA